MGFDTKLMERLILDRLQPDISRLAKEFADNEKVVGTRFVAIDQFLPEDLTLKIHQAFQPRSSAWREMSSFRERKMTSKQFDLFPSLLGEITFAIQEPQVVRLFSAITGVHDQEGDPGLYAGGLSMMKYGDFLNPHIDNSHDQFRKLYRRLNLLFYVTPDWSLQDGGNLELWDNDVKRNATIESKFNRMVLMETDSQSWHSVCKVTRQNTFRCCVSNYYFSQSSPTGADYFHVTEFKGRPDEPVRRLISSVDSALRTTVRRIKKAGFGKVDVYKGKD